ncbi:MAG: C25 family cysteine peptidase [Anaerolineae bacterium]
MLFLLWLLPMGAAPPPPERLPDRLIVEWTPPLPEFRPLPDGSVELVAAGYEIDERPGALRLPLTSALIAVPPGATASLRILSARTTVIPLPAPLAVAPEPVGAIRDEEGHPVGPAYAPMIQTVRPPSSPVALEDIGTVRGVRLARLIFYPALPEGDRLRFYRHIRVEVRWAETAVATGTGPPPDDPLLQAVRRAVLTPQNVIPAPAVSPKPSVGPMGGGSTVAFLEARAPGLYRVACDDLQRLGFNTVNPNDLRLFRGDDEVRMEWQGDTDDACESGEALFFYAEPRFSRWTAVDVYRLMAAAPGPNWMTTRSADPTGLPAAAPGAEQTFEENRKYTPDRFTPGIPPGRDGDRWVWDYLSHPGHPSQEYSFSIPARDAGQLTLWLIGFTTGPHRWDISLNGTPIGSVTWTGRTAITATLPIPPTVLREGTNTLSVTLPITEGAWLDAFAVSYVRGSEPAGSAVTLTSTGQAFTVALAAPGPYRAYDITDPLNPVRLTGFQVDGQTITVGGPAGRYFIVAESAIRPPDRIRPPEDLWGFHTAGGATGADYLIITHPAFADALGPLVELRRSQGLTVTVANVLGIYDTYGDGRPDPEAIRRFIADAYAHWSPRPVYVLLVGDGSFDPKQYRSESPPTFIPPYLLDVDPAGGETAADNRYVCVDGNDNLPDMLLGRLPVHSADEARAVVEKIADYETRPLPGGWNANGILVADDPDSAGDFPALSEASASWVTDPFTVTRRYCMGTESTQDDCDAEAPTLRTALLEDWDRGALLICYFGHSSWQQWARERLFHLDDLPALANSRRYPVVTEMTCFTGAFHRPEPTLDEALVTRPDGGAVAVWGPTGLGASMGHRRLAEGFFRAVFSDTVGTVGEATLAGKLNLGGGQGGDLLDTFNLLGDPALRFDREIVPWAAHVYLPLVRR